MASESDSIRFASLKNLTTQILQDSENSARSHAYDPDAIFMRLTKEQRDFKERENTFVDITCGWHFLGAIDGNGNIREWYGLSNMAEYNILIKVKDHTADSDDKFVEIKPGYYARTKRGKHFIWMRHFDFSRYRCSFDPYKRLPTVLNDNDIVDIAIEIGICGNSRNVFVILKDETEINMKMNENNNISLL